MLAVFDVAPQGRHQFVGRSDGGTRNVVDGSQFLGQAIVAASKTFPRHTVRTAHVIFVRAADAERPLTFEVDVVHEGRTFASAVVSVIQGGRRCASATVLLDTEHESVITHASPMPEVGPPAAAIPVDMPMVGRELRLVGLSDPNDPDEVGEPTIDAWLHYDERPARDDLAKALIAHFTGHLSISTTMRAHRGIGTAMAHVTVSTGVMAISVTFHEPVEWEGWILYHHESTQVGRGMSYVRGQVFTDRGVLIASFTQDGMIRAFDSETSTLGMPVTDRL
ncbi:MAG: acyl-CoA thioesterase domain-containing protein [Acidimicrobiales bacterium]